MIPFNKPYLTGKEISYIQDSVLRGKLSGNGYYTKLCQDFFQQKYNFLKCLLTTSCTDALEMAAILLDIQPGDEVIVPSFTFVSTANAFVLRGAKIIFADSMSTNPNIDAQSLEALITTRTKAIIPVHYAGVSCDMDSIMRIANKYSIYVVEDAAQALDNYYISSNKKMQYLGGIGHLSAFSFHETKNIIAGEGGMLVINDEKFIERAEIIWEKGTNRSAFFRGDIDKYGWVDIGSSFLPSEITAAFLWAQLENLVSIQNKRRILWEHYHEVFKTKISSLGIKLPELPKYSGNNAHMFYIICDNLDMRNYLINGLRKNGIHAVFHYQSLHASPYYVSRHGNRIISNSIHFSDRLLRFPMYYDLTLEDINKIAEVTERLLHKYTIENYQ